MGEGGACRGPARGGEEKSAEIRQERQDQTGKEKSRHGESDGRNKTEEEALGNPALGLGGIFRIDLADDAVAAVALGGIEAAVGALDEGVGVVAGLQHG